MDYALEGAASISGSVRSLPAESRGLDTDWWDTGEVVIAVSWLSPLAVAANDDVGSERTSSTEVLASSITETLEGSSGVIKDKFSVNGSGRDKGNDCELHCG